jgi:hypothetical protein
MEGGDKLRVNEGVGEAAEVYFEVKSGNMPGKTEK